MNNDQISVSKNTPSFLAVDKPGFPDLTANDWTRSFSPRKTY